MALRTLLGGLFLLTAISLSGADEGKAPSLANDAKVLAGKWQPITAMGAAKVILEFEPAKAKTTLSLTAKLYHSTGKEPKLIDSDRAEINLHDETGKRFFIREGTKVSYVLKDKKLVLDGEYEAKGTLYLLTGAWEKVQEKK